MQLTKSKDQLEKKLKLRLKVDTLAWPFGIHDEELAQQARETGYVAAFTIARHHVNSSDNIMALPRFIVTDKDVGRLFERLLLER